MSNIFKIKREANKVVDKLSYNELIDMSLKLILRPSLSPKEQSVLLMVFAGFLIGADKCKTDKEIDMYVLETQMKFETLLMQIDEFFGNTPPQGN